MTTAATVPSRSTRQRSLTTRRIAFYYPTETLPRHYVDDDLVMSHVVSVLSSLFPEGEDFFVRSVRKHRDQITDPELKSQVAGFIGQESMHGREHRNFNDRLQTMGYPTHTIDRMVAFGLGLGERILPTSVQLAITAALEHYTATLAEVLLTDAEARAMFDNEEVRSLFLWHALEESEHKAVAFDVFQTVSGSWLIRVGVMQAVTFGFLLSVVGHTAQSLVLDRATYNPRRLVRSLAKLRHSPWLRRDVIRHLRSYNTRSFHPDDRDTTELITKWKAELFEAGGPLAGRVKTSESAARAG